MTREMDKETITKTLLGFWKEVLGQEVSEIGRAHV